MGKGKTKRSAPEEVVRQRVISELKNLGWKDDCLRWEARVAHSGHAPRFDEARTRTEVSDMRLGRPSRFC